MPLVSIIMPSRNEGNLLKQTVDSVMSTTPGDYEIIVVDDQSSDGSTAFLMQSPYSTNPAIRFVPSTDRVGAVGGRHMGGRMAKGDYLVFLDAHVSLKPKWLENFMSTSSRHPDALVCGTIRSDDPNNQTPGCGEKVKVDLIPAWQPNLGAEYEVMAAPGAFVMIPKWVFNNIGGFDSGLRLWGFEDVEISIRAWELGYPIYVNTAADQNHHFKNGANHIDMQIWTYNMLRTARMHFEGKHLAEIEEQAKKNGDNYTKADQELQSDPEFKWRSDYFRSIRVMTGDQYLAKFGGWG